MSSTVESEKKETVITLSAISNGWMRCPACGRKWFYVVEAAYIRFVIVCSSCKGKYGVHLGVQVDVE